MTEAMTRCSVFGANALIYKSARFVIIVMYVIEQNAIGRRNQLIYILPR